MEEYDALLDAEVTRAYEAASAARRTGVDPSAEVEIPRAQDMAMRVEKLLAHLHLDGISVEIRRLAERMPREEAAVEMARRLAREDGQGLSLEARLDRALRVGLAILTEGILVAPLEGLAEVHVRGEGTDSAYLELYYAGPIRAAGGTAQALSVLLADVVRRDAGLGRYHPHEDEVGRYQEEIPLYKHLQHLQYVPSPEEVATVVRGVPVAISGESTEGDAQVSAFRDLPRVGTNGIRGGACLVIAEGLCQKSAKLRKIVEKLGIPGWEFLERVGHQANGEEERPSEPKYLREALGGRPILAYPNRPGGFRLVYGRARTTGLASCAINPATMVVLHRFVAIGTQVKLEYPGKATAMALCDTIEGPLLELTDGTLVGVHDTASAETVLPRVRRIIDLGELLVPFGEFLENNRPLEPGGYSLDWHLEELRSRGVPLDALALSPDYAHALATSVRTGAPLHPRFLLFWHDLSTREILRLSERVESAGRWHNGSLELSADPEWKELLVRLGAAHAPAGEGMLRLEPVAAAGLLGGLGLAVEGGVVLRRGDGLPEDDTGSPLVLVSRLAGAQVRAKGPSRIGARVGRPEKARQRSMSPNVHALFPVGEAGGPRRSVPEAARRSMGGGVPTTLGVRRCSDCGRGSVWGSCTCGGLTVATGELSTQPLPVAPLWAQALDRLHLRRVPEVKGVKGLTSRGKVPERLEKGILRAAHGISVYQDGTARFDLTDLPLTHFRPSEVGTPVVRLRELGYRTDLLGEPLTDPEQLLELRPQDLIVSRSCGKYLTHLAQFVDDELVRLYNVSPFYQVHAPEELVGAILVALAPHTSGGVAGRLIGYSDAEACFAHPLFHAAKRRNCDGDEDSVTLLLDALVNFSRAFLPDSRGALMDKPLVLTTRVDAREVDKEAHNLDVADSYPLAVFEGAAAHRSAKELESLVPTLGRWIDATGAVWDAGFTHDTSDLAGGPVRSAYREAASMPSIVEQSLLLTAQLRAVDIADAVSLVLNAHFIPDLMGNLKSFATQKFRCKACGMSYRRPPLTGRCAVTKGRESCGGELSPTVFEGAVRKYLGLSQRLARTPGVTPYLRQRIDLLENSLATLFPGTPSQTTLDGLPLESEESAEAAVRQPIPPTHT
ncbi:MAG: DNA polymerase II large subunit [Thermoplasmata archaeon]|nr:DNA polymerase II large subunit [Thermoplasmata archaeon]MCI4340919.1 DNA polymerase II large subunit [Thermoplasmata archaeon]